LKNTWEQDRAHLGKVAAELELANRRLTNAALTS